MGRRANKKYGITLSSSFQLCQSAGEDEYFGALGFYLIKKCLKYFINECNDIIHLRIDHFQINDWEFTEVSEA